MSDPGTGTPHSSQRPPYASQPAESKHSYRRTTPAGSALDDRPEGERPWSLATPSRPPTHRAGNEPVGTAEPVSVTVQYKVVDGPEGEALARRQTAAIRAALIWLRNHPVNDSNAASR